MKKLIRCFKYWWLSILGPWWLSSLGVATPFCEAQHYVRVLHSFPLIVSWLAIPLARVNGAFNCAGTQIGLAQCTLSNPYHKIQPQGHNNTLYKVPSIYHPPIQLKTIYPKNNLYHFVSHLPTSTLPIAKFLPIPITTQRE